MRIAGSSRRSGGGGIAFLALAAALVLAGCTGEPGETPATLGSGGVDEPPGEPGEEAASPPATGADWIDVESTEGGFRVKLPNHPVRDEQVLEAEGVALDAVTFSSVQGEDVVYSVGYTDYPEAVLDLEPEVVLDAAVQGAASQVAGQVASSEALTVDGFPAVDYLVTVGAGQLQARAILVGQRLYVLQRTGAEADPAGFQRLVDSFELSRLEAQSA